MSQERSTVHRFTREALYELVWSEPMSKLARRLGVSRIEDWPRHAPGPLSPYLASGTGQSLHTARRLAAYPCPRLGPRSLELSRSHHRHLRSFPHGYHLKSRSKSRPSPPSNGRLWFRKDCRTRTELSRLGWKMSGGGSKQRQVGPTDSRHAVGANRNGAGCAYLALCSGRSRNVATR